MKKYLPRYNDCFVCGKDNAIGLKRRFYVITDDTGEIGDYVYADMTFSKEYEGFKSVVHGGVITALIDEAMGWAATVQTGLMYVTVDLNISFKKPVMVGEKLTFKAKMTQNVKRVAKSQGLVLNNKGSVLVKATGRFFPLSAKNTKKVIEYLSFDKDTYDVFDK